MADAPGPPAGRKGGRGGGRGNARSSQSRKVSSSVKKVKDSVGGANSNNSNNGNNGNNGGRSNKTDGKNVRDEDNNGSSGGRGGGKKKGRGQYHSKHGKNKRNNSSSSSSSSNSKKDAEEAERLRLLALKKQEEEERRKEEERREELRKEWTSAVETSVCDRVRSMEEAIGRLEEVSGQVVELQSVRSRVFAEEQELWMSKKKSLKSDLKKCTAFCKKCKAATTQWKDPSALLKDVETLNLTRYVEEIASALTSEDTFKHLKLTEVAGITKLCIALHCKYVDFMPALLNALNSSLLPTSSNRIALRLYTELLAANVIHDFKPILKLITPESPLLLSFAKAAALPILHILPTQLHHDQALLHQQLQLKSSPPTLSTAPAHNSTSTSTSTQNQTQNTHNQNQDTHHNPENHNHNTALSSEDHKITELLELVIAQKSITEPEALQTLLAQSQQKPLQHELLDKAQATLNQFHHLWNATGPILPPEPTQTLLDVCLSAYQTTCRLYLRTSTQYKERSQKADKDRLIQGSLSTQREQNLIELQQQTQTYFKSMETLSQLLHQPLPSTSSDNHPDDNDPNQLPDGTSSDKAQNGLELYKDSADANSNANTNNFGPFDDEETKSFYTTLPDMLTIIPPALLGYTPHDVETILTQNNLKYGNNNNHSSHTSIEEETSNPNNDSAADDPSSLLPKDDDDESTNAESKDNKEDSTTPHYNKLTLLLEQELPECNRRDKMDELTEKFCVNHGASIKNRKRLQKALLLVPRTRLDLLPYYARMAAILDRVYPDISSTLVKELEQQFHGLARWKKQTHLESRLRNARYLSELTKFRVSPPIVVLRCLRRCLDDFTGYNIDVACCLLENCGRYLHRTPHTTERLANLMDTMMRIRKAKIFEERHVALIQSAFYMVNPPTSSMSSLTKKQKEPLEEYLQHLLTVRVIMKEGGGVSFVSKQLLRFPSDKHCMIVRYIFKACRKGTYTVVAALAQVVSNLRRTHPEIVVRVMDTVLEQIQWALEHPQPSYQQRTVTYIKFLGELFRQNLLASTILFDQLYNLINFGHDIPPALHQQATTTTTPATSTADVISGPSSKITQAIPEEAELEEDEEDKNVQTEEEKVSVAPMGTCVFSKFDPRVPFALDSPTSVFRVTLVCTLLDSVASTLVTNNHKQKMEQFLAAFQRYLFIKSTIPTEVEFAILDTFETLDKALNKNTTSNQNNSNDKQKSNIYRFCRYSTWLDAHKATIAAEEAIANATAKAQARLLIQAGVIDTNTNNKATAEDNIMMEEDMHIIEDIEEDDTLLEEESINSSSSSDDDDDDSSSSCSDASIMSEEEIMEDIEDDDSDESDEEDDSIHSDNDSCDEYNEEEEEKTQEAYMRQLEEEALDRELRRLTLDAIEKGKVAARTGTGGKVSDGMPAASVLRKPKPESSNTTVLTTLGGTQGMTFQLLKKGAKGRVEAKELIVPTTTNLAQVATKYDEDAEKERHMLKARVLQYEDDSYNHDSGNVYMESTKLPFVRNRPLQLEDIDRNFGNTKHKNTNSSNTERARYHVYGRGTQSSGRGVYDPSSTAGGRGRFSR